MRRRIAMCALALVTSMAGTLAAAAVSNAEAEAAIRAALPKATAVTVFDPMVVGDPHAFVRVTIPTAGVTDRKDVAAAILDGGRIIAAMRANGRDDRPLAVELSISVRTASGKAAPIQMLHLRWSA